MRRRLSLVLVFVLLIAQPVFAGTSINKGHWAYDTMMELAKDRVFSPVTLDWEFDQQISRAAFVRLVNKAYGNQVQSEIAFTDVTADSIYYKDIAMAVGSGMISGYPDGTFKPNAGITRQEAATILSKVTRKDNVLVGVVNAFGDGNLVPEWSRDNMAWMIQNQYMSGYPDGTIGFERSVTYAEALAMVDNILGERMMAEMVDGGGRVINGNVSILQPNVTLSNMEINGDLMIGGQVGEGDVTLDNVKVNGRLLVYGGGENSIHLLRAIIKEMIVSKLDAPVRIVADEDSQVTDALVETSTIIVTDGEVIGSVTIQPMLFNMAIDLDGTFGEVLVTDNPAFTKALEALEALGEEQVLEVKIPLGAIIRNMTVEQKAEIKGLGKVIKAAIKSNKVKLDVDADELDLGSGVELVDKTPGGGGTSGGSSGGASGIPSAGGSSNNSDDSAAKARGYFSFDRSAETITEGNDLILKISRTGGVHGNVGVYYTVTGSAVTAGVDYTVPSPSALSVGSGQSSALITIPILDDNVTESVNETFTVELTALSGGAALGSTTTVTVTILDAGVFALNDVAPVNSQMVKADFSDIIDISTTSSGGIQVTSGAGITISNIEFESDTDHTNLMLTLSEPTYEGVEITFSNAVKSDDPVALSTQVWRYNGTDWVLKP